MHITSGMHKNVNMCFPGSISSTHTFRYIYEGVFANEQFLCTWKVVAAFDYASVLPLLPGTETIMDEFRGFGPRYPPWNTGRPYSHLTGKPENHRTQKCWEW